MVNTLFPRNCLEFFQALDRHHVRFMVVGMAGVALQGGVVATDDIDLWVENLGQQDFLDAVHEVGGHYNFPMDLRPPYLAGALSGPLDLVMHLSGLGNFEDEYRFIRRIEIDGHAIPVLRLDRIIVSKRAANRPKDQAVLPLLETLQRMSEGDGSGWGELSSK